MALNVYLGVCSAENEVVDKTDYITWEEDATSCNMVNTDLLNPILKMDKYVKGINYVKIPYFEDRCYFVEGYEGVSGTHCLLRCHVDVLHTYRDAISALQCLVYRNEDEEKWNRDMTDKSLPVTNRRIGITRNVSDDLIVNPMEDAEFLLQYF